MVCHVKLPGKFLQIMDFFQELSNRESPGTPQNAFVYILAY